MLRRLLISIAVAGAALAAVPGGAAAQGVQGRWQGTIDFSASGTRTYGQYYWGVEEQEQTYGSSQHSLQWRLALDAPGGYDPVEAVIDWRADDGKDHNATFESFQWSGSIATKGTDGQGNECTYNASGSYSAPIEGGVTVYPGWLQKLEMDSDATGQVSVTQDDGCSRPGVGFRSPDPFDQLLMSPPYEGYDRLGRQNTLCSYEHDYGPENLASQVRMIDGRWRLRLTGQASCSGRHVYGFGDSGLPQDDAIDITYTYDLTLEPACDPGEVSTVRVAKAVAVGCFEPLGDGLYETDQAAQLAGIDISPFETVVVDSRSGSLGGSARVSLGGVVLPIEPAALPVRRDTWDLSVAASKTGNVFKGMPVSGSFSGKWIDGGAGLTATASVDIEALAKRSGVDAVVSGSYVSRPGGAFTFEAHNGQGVDLKAAEVRIGEVSLLPRAWTRFSRRIQLKDVKLAYRDDRGVDEWSGAATLALPIYRNGTAVTLAGRLTVRDASFAAAGATVDNLNVPGPYGIYFQGGELDVRFLPSLGLRLAGLGSYGPRVFGKALLDGSLALGFGGLANVRCEGADASLDALVKHGLSEDFPIDAEISGGSCIDLERLALEQFVQAKLGFEKGFGLEGSLEGWISGTTGGFELAGTSKVRLPALPDLNGKSIVSDRGIAACGTVTWFTGGFGYRWGDSFPDAFRGCGLSAWSSGGARAAQAKGATVTVTGSPAYVGIRATAAAGPPRVRVTGPDGSVFESPADASEVRLDERVLIYPQPGDVRTVVLVRGPAAGPWRVESLDGSAIAVESAEALPPVRVRGRVSGAGRKRLLRWRATAPAGQRLVFVERGAGVARELVATDDSSGTQRFRPTVTRERARRVVAQVLQDGVPRETVTVARFKAPAPPRLERPRKLRARARGGAVNVQFKGGSGSRRWLLTLRRGAQALDLLLTRRSVTVRQLGWRPAKASVKAIGLDGRLSRAATSRVR